MPSGWGGGGLGLGSDLNASRLFAVLPWAGDLTSVSLKFLLICKMVFIIPRLGSVNECEAGSSGTGRVVAQPARGSEAEGDDCPAKDDARLGGEMLSGQRRPWREPAGCPGP